MADTVLMVAMVALGMLGWFGLAEYLLSGAFGYSVLYHRDSAVSVFMQFFIAALAIGAVVLAFTFPGAGPFPLGLFLLFCLLTERKTIRQNPVVVHLTLVRFSLAKLLGATLVIGGMMAWYFHLTQAGYKHWFLLK